jgi:hypothetical protein
MCNVLTRAYSCACKLPLTLFPNPCAAPLSERQKPGHPVEEILDKVDFKCDPCWQKQREEEQAKKFDLQAGNEEECEEGERERDEEVEMERLRRKRGGSASAS